MKRSFSHIAPNLGYLSSDVIAHNGGFTNIIKKSINPRMKEIKYPNNLKLIREHRRLSQEALAELVGTTKGQIYKLEAGERKLSHPWMVRLSAPLKCNASDFIDDPSKLDLDSQNQPVHDTDIAINFALKAMINEIISIKKSAKQSLRNEFLYALEHLDQADLPGAVVVMTDLMEHVSEKSPPKMPEKMRQLLQLAPVGSA